MFCDKHTHKENTRMRGIFSALRDDRRRLFKLVDFETLKIITLKPHSSYSAQVHSCQGGEKKMFHVVIQTVTYPKADCFWFRGNVTMKTPLMDTEEYYNKGVTFHNIHLKPSRGSPIIASLKL